MFNSDTEKNALCDFLNINDNDSLTNMSGKELQELIILLNDYRLEFRNVLNLDNNITFGLELEFEQTDRRLINYNLKRNGFNDEWLAKGDGSLGGMGGEISTPVLVDDELAWKQVDKVCSIVKPLAVIGNKSAGHIHVGAQILGNNKKYWLNFIKLWAIYENIIFRFLYGEFLTYRSTMMEYAKPIKNEFLEIYEILIDDCFSLERVLTILSDFKKRSWAVNFSNISIVYPDIIRTGNTIEFRCPNGTLESIVWQNNVNFCIKMLNYCASSSYRDDLILKRYEYMDNSMNLDLYGEIFLEQALEFGDLIFDNNLDKINFLKQYLKSFQVYNQNSEYLNSKVLNLIKKN